MHTREQEDLTRNAPIWTKANEWTTHPDGSRLMVTQHSNTISQHLKLDCYTTTHTSSCFSKRTRWSARTTSYITYTPEVQGRPLYLLQEPRCDAATLSYKWYNDESLC